MFTYIIQALVQHIAGATGGWCYWWLLRDTECSLDDDNILNQFYVMENNNDNFSIDNN